MLHSVLGLPNQVEELCPDIPELETLMKEIHDLAESGARYTEMPHVIEITLPMLCNYLPRWWERGPENFPEQEGQLCTSVTSEHLNQLLGSIMKIVVNNLGIDEASWMKRLAGQWAVVSQLASWLISHSTVSFPLINLLSKLWILNMYLYRFFL